MPNELTDFGNRVSKVTDRGALERMAAKAGAAGKQAALDAAAADLGGDRRFSGMRRKAALSAGWDDIGNGQVAVNFRPAGLWKLAESGRQRSKPIVPRKRGGKRAVLTPHGPRARSTSEPSRGLDTFSEAVRDARREVPRAAARQFSAEVRKVVR